MARIEDLPPVFLSDDSIKLQVSREAKRGHIRKIGPRLYTTEVKDDPASVIRRNLWEVVSLLFPKTVVAYRTAIEGKPSSDGTVNVVGGYDRIVTVPGLIVRQIKGPGPLPGDTPFMRSLWLASRARALLECLKPSRARAAGAKGFSRPEIETLLERWIRISGEDAANQIRDRAREIAPALGTEGELRRLLEIIGSILGTRRGELTSPVAQARASGEPYDPDRLDLFQALHATVLAWPATPRPLRSFAAPCFENEAFLDAYFSNFIEGTEFGLDEAIEIAFEGRIPEHRPADAHDVAGTFRVAASREEMQLSLADPRVGFEDFTRVLRRRHEIVMSARPDKDPGEFKQDANFAGDTAFVSPELVIGTLRRGYELFRSLQEPFARAAFMMFLLTEVHPFMDGNGRIARIMMNAELISAGQCRMIIPTVYRDDYMLALRAVTRQRRTDGFLRMLDRAQELVSRIDFCVLDEALAAFRRANAFALPSEARLILPPREAEPETL